MKRFVSLVTVAILAAVPLALSGGSAAAAAAPSFTITPNPVVAGNTITFSGTGCLPIAGDKGDFPQVDVAALETPVASAATGLARMNAKIKPFDDNTVLTAAPKADGTWSAPLDVPAYVVGDFTFGATCDHYNSSTPYEPVTLRVTANPNSPVTVILADFYGQAGVPALSTGVSYEIAGIGFASGEKVQVLLHSAPVVLTTLTADQFGTVDGFFTLPAGTTAGRHTLSLAGLTSKKTGSLPITVKANAVTTVTATVTVSSPNSSTPVPSATASTTAALAATTSTSGPTLAATGTPAAAMSWIGVVLTLLGAATMVLARRRSPRVH